MRLRVLFALVVVALLAGGGCDSGAPAPTTVPTLPTPTPSGESAATAEPEATPEVAPTNTSEGGPVLTPTGRPSGAGMTIVALGDSLTEGDGDEPYDRGGYPTRLREMAERVRPGTRVVNLGKSGWDSGQLVSDQLPGAVAERPQIALVWIGSNDLWNNNYADVEESDRGTFTANVDTILRTLTGAGARVYVALLDDQSKRPIASDAEGRYNAEDRARMARRVVAYNDIIRAKAAEYGATTLDFYNTTLFTDPATLSVDGIHPNARGYDIIAEMWYRAVEGELGR